jgi:hypothetical protein
MPTQSGHSSASDSASDLSDSVSDAAQGVGSDGAVELAEAVRTVEAFRQDTEDQQPVQNDCLPSVEDRQAAYL